VTVKTGQTKASAGDTVKATYKVTGGGEEYNVAYSWIWVSGYTQTYGEFTYTDEAAGDAFFTVPENAQRVRFYVVADYGDEYTYDYCYSDWITIDPAPSDESLIITAKTAQKTASKGDKLSLTYSYTGGVGDCTVTCVWSVYEGDDGIPVFDQQSKESSGEFSFTVPDNAWRVKAYVQVMDSKGHSDYMYLDWTNIK
jgi:hypothetical protein